MWANDVDIQDGWESYFYSRVSVRPHPGPTTMHCGRAGARSCVCSVCYVEKCLLILILIFIISAMTTMTEVELIGRTLPSVPVMLVIHMEPQ